MFVGAIFAADSNNTKKFEVVSIDGKKFHFTVTSRGVLCDEAKGKVLLIDFFGKNCPPCRASIPVLAKIYKEMGDKVQIIALHVQQKLTPRDISMLKKELGINYPVVDMMADGRNYEFVEYLGAVAGWKGTIPFMLFFDKEGNYRAQHYGMVDYKKLKDFIEKLYKEKD